MTFFYVTSRIAAVSNEPIHVVVLLITLISNEGSTEPAQMSRLTRDFTACIHKFGF